MGGVCCLWKNKHSKESELAREGLGHGGSPDDSVGVPESGLSREGLLSGRLAKSQDSAMLGPRWSSPGDLALELGLVLRLLQAGGCPTSCRLTKATCLPRCLRAGQKQPDWQLLLDVVMVSALCV